MWSEWRFRGTHTDGTGFALAGVIVAGLGDAGLIRWNRLYLEPVEQAGQGIEDVVGTLSKTLPATPPGRGRR